MIFKGANSLPPILAACPNGGGLFCLVGGRGHLVRRESVTGLAIGGEALYSVVQDGDANEIRRTTTQGSTIFRLTSARMDLHDLLMDDGDLYAVVTENNEVVRLDGSFHVVERWHLPGEVDAAHVNCLAMFEGRLLATLFGPFKAHREYKGQTHLAGLVVDVRTGEVLISGLSQPHSMVGADGVLYVCNSEQEQLLVYRDFHQVAEVTLGAYTRGLAIDSTHLYVGLSESRSGGPDGGHAQVVVLDRGTLAEVGRISLPCREVYALLPLTSERLLQCVVAALGEDLADCNARLAEARSLAQSHAAEGAAAQASQVQQASAMAGLEEARAQLEARLDSLQLLLKEREEHAGQLIDQLQKRESWLTEIKTHADGLAVLRAELEARLHGAADEANTLRGELAVRDVRIEALQAACAERQQRLADVSHLQAGYDAMLSELRAQLDDLKAHRSVLEGNVATLEATATRLRDHNRLGEERLAQISALLDSTRLQHVSDLAAAAQLRGDLEAEIEQLRMSLGASSLQLGRYEAEIEAGERALHQSEARLRDMGTLLDLRYTELKRVMESNSWKLSAPLRWMRNLWIALREGRRPAPYADMLKVPAARELLAGEKRDAPETAVAATAPDQQTYLDQIFSDESSKQAPEFTEAGDLSPPEPGNLRAKLIAFYLPQFHPFPENDAWWGKGFTEWTNVARAVPQFLGHHQPHLPADLGFYDLRLPEVLRQQVDLARQYGIQGFCFHYYWFAGHRLLERPLDLFVAQSDIDFPFCLCWANENWTRRWDGRDSEILIAQEHSAENDIAFIRDLIPYLGDPRYIRIDGRPLVVVYRPSILPDCAATLTRWREYCRATGVGELFLAMVQFDTEDPNEYGFDVAMEFPPHKLARGLDAINHKLDIANPHYAGHVVHYQDIVDVAKSLPAPRYPMFRGVFPGWDNEARRPGKGYTFAFSTPTRYRDWLECAVSFAEANPVQGEKIVMINAWNEWAEGAHLEPDRRYGHAFLKATREVVERRLPRPKVVVVSHDAHPHGAQYLALNLIGELKRIGCQVEAVLLGPGILRERFERSCVTHRLYDQDYDKQEELAKDLVERGFDLVFANTAVSGRIARQFADAGARIVSLIHELPGVIREYGLEQFLQDLVACAVKVIAPSEAVANGLRQFLGEASLKDVLMLRPQGLFTRSRYRADPDNNEARSILRRKLGIPADSQILLTVGYADRRKGVDLIVEIAGLVASELDGVHFVWVGHHDVSIHAELLERLRQNGMSGRFHFVGLDFDTDNYYAGADLYALSSREDPFPSVVLESLSVGVPVVAFQGTGGAADLLEAQGGRVVPAFEVEAYAAAIVELLRDEGARRALGEAGREMIDREFSFRAYAMDLLACGGVAIPRVSVIVPNYNYAHYLRDRLRSIAAQTLPLYEIIVLDDCSTDDSIGVLRTLRAEIEPEPRVVVNASNSGSVFRQWLRGVELARGEFVWIAEADDLSSPGFLEALLEPMVRDESIVMSYCQSRQIDKDGKVLAEDYLAYTDDLSGDRWLRDYVVDGRDEVESGLAIKNVIPNVSGVLFRRNALLDVLRGHIDEICAFKIAGDWVSYLRLLSKGRIAFVSRSLNLHRRHSSSVTIGSDVKPHYDEVISAQRLAAELFGLGERSRDLQAQYARTLEKYFALDQDGEGASVR